MTTNAHPRGAVRYLWSNMRWLRGEITGHVVGRLILNGMTTDGEAWFIQIPGEARSRTVRGHQLYKRPRKGPPPPPDLKGTS